VTTTGLVGFLRLFSQACSYSLHPPIEELCAPAEKKPLLFIVLRLSEYSLLTLSYARSDSNLMFTNSGLRTLALDVARSNNGGHLNKSAPSVRWNHKNRCESKRIHLNFVPDEVRMISDVNPIPTETSSFARPLESCVG
jgi:hypothetical protein